MHYNQERHRGKPGKFIFFLLVGSSAILLIGLIVMQLWNAILPSLLRVNRITYPQSLGLLALCRILFGNIRFGPRRPHKYQHPGQAWREKLLSMSPEERRKFREEWRRRRGLSD